MDQPSLQEVQGSLGHLRKYLLDATVAGFLPVYDRGRCENVCVLHQSMTTFSLTLAPATERFGQTTQSDQCKEDQGLRFQEEECRTGVCLSEAACSVTESVDGAIGDFR